MRQMNEIGDMKKWDKRFLRLAREVSTYSKDPSTKVGAVIVSPDKKDIILGYNGFASKMSDDPVLYADREKKYGRIIHAEINAIINAKRPLDLYTLYTWPFLTCERCACCVIQSGITRVVSRCPTEDQADRWGTAFINAREYFEDAGVRVDEFAITGDDLDA